MIDYEGRNWLDVLFRAQGSVAPRLAVRVFLAAAVGVVASWTFDDRAFHLSAIAHSMIGAALGLLLVFRTNASYDRYWEGRRLLGAMVNKSRDLARQLVAFMDGEDLHVERTRVRSLVCAFYLLSAQSLRGENDLERLAHLLSDDDRSRLAERTARPAIVLAWATALLAHLARDGRLTEQRLQLLDRGLSSLLDSLGGCERIQKTPVPFAYAQHIKMFVALFCFTAPFALSEAMGWYTPVASGLLAFALFGIDEIGVEIEDPFGYDANDLPLDAIGDGIEKATQAILDAGP